MEQKTIKCAILGAQEVDLGVLSELHRQEAVRIAYLFDPEDGAVGLEIAEIMGIPGYTSADDLDPKLELDYIVVSEPRSRFADALEQLSGSGARIMTSSEALRALGGEASERSAAAVDVDDDAFSVEDTLVALERLFDRRELLKFLLEVAVKATESTAGSIMLYSTETKELYIAYATGLSERVIKNTRQKLGQGIAGGVAQSRQAKLLKLEHGHALYARDRERMDITSAISVPLMWAGDLLGVLNVSSGGEGRAHEEADLERLKKLSRRLSRVLYESLKLQEVQMRHRESRFRSTMTELAAKEVAAHEKFTVLATYLSDIVGADAVEILVNTQEGDWFALGGSNRILSPERERVRIKDGALGRAFLERRSIVLAEKHDPSGDPLETSSSAVYCYLPVQNTGGVLVLEFAEPLKLDEFLIIKDAILQEVARFVSHELRERRLQREIDSFARISDAAATLLSSRTLDELGRVLARVVIDVLEAERVSVRLRASDDEPFEETFISGPGASIESWRVDDEERFERVEESRESFTMAFLDFQPGFRGEDSAYRTMLASPIRERDALLGGIIAYDKHPHDPMEDAIFSDLDRKIIAHLGRIILPVIDSIRRQLPADLEVGPGTYQTILADNRDRFGVVCESEISRADRYHHSFACILFKIEPLEALFEKDPKRALGLVDEITQGLRTRTRKTDYGAWLDRSTFALLSLEGGQRIRFLIARATIYLMKDLAGVEGMSLDDKDVLVGSAIYPGNSRTASDLLEEARANLKAHSQD